MRIIHGKRARAADPAAIVARAAAYPQVLVDLGTGDGRFVRRAARESPACLAIGLDACQEGLREESRKAPGNALYVVADALALPVELHGLATQVTVNFPWGSLLRGLLDGDERLLAGLRRLFRDGAGRLEIRLNAGALAGEGWEIDTAGERLRRTLTGRGYSVEEVRLLDRAELRAFPSTWARRLAFGRDPRALYLRAALGVACPCARDRHQWPGPSVR